MSKFLILLGIFVSTSVFAKNPETKETKETKAGWYCVEKYKSVYKRSEKRVVKYRKCYKKVKTVTKDTKKHTKDMKTK